MKAGKVVSAVLRRLLALEWLLAGAAAPVLIFPTLRPAWTAAALGTLALWWLMHWALRREPWPVTPFNGALLLFTLMLLVGIRVSPAQEITLPDATRVVLGLVTFRAVAMAAGNRRGMAPAVAVLCLFGVALIGVGILGAQWSAKMPVLGELGQRIPRLITTVPEDQGTPGVNPNHLAGALTLYLPLALALVFGPRLSRRAIVGPILGLLGSLLFLGLVAGALLLTQSRSGWIGWAAGVVALLSLAGLTSRHRWARPLGAVLPILAVLGVAGAVIYLGPQSLGESLFGKGVANPVEEVVGDITLEGRMEIWSRALYGIQDFPFTGCGLGAFQWVVPVLYPLFTVPPDTDIGHAHNIFLQTALDLGIPGLVACLALLMIALAVCWRAARCGDPLVRPLALGLAGGLVALHAYGLTDAMALGSKPAVAFWFALGLIAALPRVSGSTVEAPRVTPHASRFTHYARTHRWPVAAIALFIVALISIGGYFGWRALRQIDISPAGPSIRLLIYPGAQDVRVRTEIPADGSGWTGSLEVATFVTTYPITDVAAFYTDVLSAAGWVTEIRTEDEGSWGGIYWRDGGREVCLLNAFRIEGKTTVSIVCGDKAVAPAVPSPSPTPSAPQG